MRPDCAPVVLPAAFQTLLNRPPEPVSETPGATAAALAVATSPALEGTPDARSCDVDGLKALPAALVPLAAAFPPSASRTLDVPPPAAPADDPTPAPSADGVSSGLRKGAGELQRRKDLTVPLSNVHDCSATRPADTTTASKGPPSGAAKFCSMVPSSAAFCSSATVNSISFNNSQISCAENLALSNNGR